MIKINNLCYSFPQKDLFNMISFNLEEGDHCAFIGVSGSGKSTLIDLIRKPDQYMYEGDMEIDPTCRIGYVGQSTQNNCTDEITVFEYIGAECIRLKKRLEAICTEMETGLNIEVLLEEYQETLDAFEALGGENFESDICKKLNLAGLMHHKDLLITKLSGGEFKLVQIIKEMMTFPHLLIMDEPDVFLDFENLTALKNLINTHKGTLLIVTHNRYLLNHCFNKILHLENKELQEFDGSYMDYQFSLLQRKIELQELALADAAEIERNEALIDKLRTEATNNAEAARGKTLKARIKIQERLEARRIKAPFVEIKQPNLELTTSRPLVDSSALKLSDYSLAFTYPLLNEVSIEIGATDKVALIGANGTGKTSLLRQIFQNDHPALTVSNELHMAYLSQMQNERLNETQTILQEFLDLGFERPQDIKDYLKRFGFEEEMLTQKISALSGGEKNILQLAKIAYGDTNFLLLDEPTSHLDTYAQLAMEDALKNYNGGILMVSHDFYSIAHCMDYVLIIEDQTIRKMSMRKFRKMIYARHFDKDYLLLETKKKEAEMKVAKALEKNNFELAKKHADELATLMTTL